MFCPKCGRINPDEEIVCKGCGATLHEEKEEVAPQNKGLIKKLVIAAVIIIIAVAVVIIRFK